MKNLRCLGLLLILPLAGCSKVATESIFVTEPGEAKILVIDPPRQDQAVRIEFSSDEPVNVAVLLSADANDATSDAVIEGNEPAKALGSRTKSQSGSFDVSVPKGSEFQIITAAAGGKSANVTLKVNSR